jgi:hypothetical protein
VDDKVKTETPKRRPLGYGVGSLAVLIGSIGVAAIVYSIPLVTFYAYSIPVWLFGPWGLYTIVYAFITGRDLTYYLTWGTVIFCVALISALYTLINPFVIFGILLIVLAVIGVATYWRGRR